MFPLANQKSSKEHPAAVFHCQLLFSHDGSWDQPSSPGPAEGRRSTSADQTKKRWSQRGSQASTHQQMFDDFGMFFFSRPLLCKILSWKFQRSRLGPPSIESQLAGVTTQPSHEPWGWLAASLMVLKSTKCEVGSTEMGWDSGKVFFGLSYVAVDIQYMCLLHIHMCIYIYTHTILSYIYI